jgi:hypothetical protein
MLWLAIKILVLLTIYCNPRLLETRCLVYCVYYTYCLPLTLSVIYVSLIPTYLRICVYSIYLIALIASCSIIRIVLRLYLLERLVKMQF